MEAACHLSEEDLLSGLDRNAPEVMDHVAQCPQCQAAAADYHAGVNAIETALASPDRKMPARIGPYLIHRRLGEGGMGIVYEAEQQAPRRLVALKVVRGGLHVDEYRLRLFEREAQTLGRLKHPAIAAIFEGGCSEDGQPYFAMELVNGAPLTQYAREHELGRRDRLSLFLQVCDAITYAHLRGVIHRDIKPSNVLVDVEGRPKVLDFGLARITDPEGALKTETLQLGRIMGTLPYMSPEEARGQADGVDVRSDIYSLGVVLFELLTDQLPYTVRRNALPEAVRIICEDPPRKPGSLDRSLRGDLETITMKALEKEPARRYQSVAAMADDLHRHLTHQPIWARRASVIYQVRKLIARHRAATLFLVALTTALVGLSWWANRGEEFLRAQTQYTLNVQELRTAKLEERYAQDLMAQGRHDEAEPHFRNALATYRNLGRYDWAGATRVYLAMLLIDRPALQERGKDSDYENAQTLLLDAIDSFQRLGRGGREGLKDALLTLRRLYGPDHWDIPENLETVNADLERLESQAPPLEDNKPQPSS